MICTSICILYINFADMQQESPISSHYTIDNQPVNHYPPSFSNTFSDTLYRNRRENDLLLERVISLTQQNNDIERQNEQYQATLPPFLLRQWNSNEGIEKLMTFLHKFSSQIQQESDVMNQRMREWRGENEFFEADYEEQLKESKDLKSIEEELEGKLLNLKRKNQTSRVNITRLINTQQILQSQYIQQEKVLNSIQGQKQHIKDQKILIESFFNDQPFLADKEEHYYAIHQKFVDYLRERKEDSTSKVNQLKDSLQILDERIDLHLKEKQQKEELKESIVVMHRKVEEMRKQLETAKVKTAAAQAKKKQMEQRICDDKMEKAIKAFDQLIQEYRGLAGRALHMVGQTLNKPNINNIQKILHHE